MILLYVVATFLFFLWWVRGDFLPAAFLAFVTGALLLVLLYVDHAMGSKDPLSMLEDGNTPFLVAAFLLSFAPRYIRAQIERRREERLHGLRITPRL
ncbi:hypothetical protein KGY14_05185 [Ameyamaea chiangmaiensis]|uniref:Uncharacterized protein n=1 Tax=Ameyamaea chiangmaiensis TaxID=442969 RepID=A0A850P5Y0_9PROT|nr:hypothetical protein [Ameyamaea chiangmaiensis]MBS4074582.1 hypothetical protein [Ameyamaea chiangmaiensis]NVN39338.1 hypothetical protein [Ameyamaea chiangmaiensis]